MLKSGKQVRKVPCIASLLQLSRHVSLYIIAYLLRLVYNYTCTRTVGTDISLISFHSFVEYVRVVFCRLFYFWYMWTKYGCDYMRLKPVVVLISSILTQMMYADDLRVVGFFHNPLSTHSFGYNANRFTVHDKWVLERVGETRYEN